MKKESLTKKLINQEDELNRQHRDVEHLRHCLRDKDERLKKVESRLHLVYVLFKTVVFFTGLIGSFALWLHTWIYIASNGTLGILQGIPSGSAAIPYTLTNEAGIALGFVMAILFILLIIGWSLILIVFFVEDE